VARKSSKCFSVRHFPYGVWGGHGDADRALVGGQSYQRFEEMEHRSANSGRRSSGAYRQARHTDDGRVAGHRFSNHFDFVMGTAKRSLCLGHHHRDPGVRSRGVRRRLSKAGEAAQPRTNWTSEAGARPGISRPSIRGTSAFRFSKLPPIRIQRQASAMLARICILRSW